MSEVNAKKDELGSVETAGGILNLSRIRQKKEDKKNIMLLLSEVEELANAMVEANDSDGTSTSTLGDNNKAIQNNTTKNDDGEGYNAAEENDMVTSLTGSSLFVENGLNGVIAFLLKLQEQQSELQSLNNKMTAELALHIGGISKNVDAEGNVTYTQDKGIVMAICDSIQDAGNSDALKTMIAGIKELSSGLTTLGMTGITSALHGTTDEEENNVKLIENAQEKEKTIAIRPKATLQEQETEEDEDLIDKAVTKEGINILKRGGYDFTKEDNHFGSVKSTAKKSIFSKKLRTIFKKESDKSEEYEKQAEDKDHKFKRNFLVSKYTEEELDELDNGALSPVYSKRITVEQALQRATPEEREVIRDKMQTQLDKAKSKLAAKRSEINANSQKFQNLANALSTTLGAASTMSQKSYIVQQAKAQATQKADEATQSSLNQMMSDQSQNTKKYNDRVTSTGKDLEQMINLVGQQRA